MSKRVSTTLILFAWLIATGSQWDLVQTYAWGKMFAGYAQTMNFAAAAERTFDADLPCELCKAVSKAKEAQNAAIPSAKLSTKMLLVFQPAAAVVFLGPEKNAWVLSELHGLSAGRSAPPSPPPRCAAV